MTAARVDDPPALLADLVAEQDALATLVDGIDRDAWLAPTPARGWDVRDTIAHLAHTDELAVDTVLGGPRSLNEYAARHASPQDTTYAGVLLGRRRAGRAVLDWWQAARARERDVLAAADPDARVAWGLGMRLPSFLSARLMETWAHSLDVHAALGVAPHDTDRLRHVAWIGIRALPYAFTKVGLAPPDEPIRFELTLPSGARWVEGPAGAPHHVTGSAGELCRVVVQRLDARDATTLTADSELAETALRVARAFL